jgi:hypothetical protein
VGTESSGQSDPSKCLENGGFDNDCCAKESEASCADDYVRVMSGIYCKGKKYAVYMCYPPGSEPSSDPEPSACLENGGYDNDCCAKPSQAGCAAGYTLELSGTYCYHNTYERYACYSDGTQVPTPAPAPTTTPTPATTTPTPAATPAPPTPVINYTAMLGGQPCEQLCVMEYNGKCGGLDTSPGKASLVKDREGCMHYYSWGKDGTLTPCTINRGGKCHKNVNKNWKCWDYVQEDTLRAACEAAGASPDVEPWASFS